MWGITSTNGDGELVQTTLEAVDGSLLGGFLVKFVPLGNCSGVERFLYAVVDAEMHLDLYWWLHLVRGSAGIRETNVLPLSQTGTLYRALSQYHTVCSVVVILCSYDRV